MILIDTSVWVDHLRHSEPRLVDLLNNAAVLIHPFIIEELACGNLPRRAKFLELLNALPLVRMASHLEVLHLIASRKLFGTGLGSVDVHLIASAMITRAGIWSKDKAMRREASKLGVGDDI